MNMTPAERIRAARLKSGMTQAELAKAIGITTKWGQSIVAQYEMGSRQIPRKRLRLAAEVLGLRLSDLI